jgi:hypothetical protein
MTSDKQENKAHSPKIRVVMAAMSAKNQLSD